MARAVQLAGSHDICARHLPMPIADDVTNTKRPTLPFGSHEGAGGETNIVKHANEVRNSVASSGSELRAWNFSTIFFA